MEVVRHRNLSTESTSSFSNRSIEEASKEAEEEVTALGEEVIDVKCVPCNHAFQFLRMCTAIAPKAQQRNPCDRLIRVSEIVDGARCFLHTVSGKGSEQLQQVDEKMKQLTTAVRFVACLSLSSMGHRHSPHAHATYTNMDEQEGLKGKLAYEVRRGNIVAAVFDDGESGPLWCVETRVYIFRGVADGDHALSLLREGSTKALLANRQPIAWMHYSGTAPASRRSSPTTAATRYGRHSKSCSNSISSWPLHTSPSTDRPFAFQQIRCCSSTTGTAPLCPPTSSARSTARTPPSPRR